MIDPVLLDVLAAAMHENYLRRAAVGGWSVKAEVSRPFAELPAGFQEANRAAARRIPEVLSAIGLVLVPVAGAWGGALDEAALAALVEAEIERLAAAEHEGWTRQRLGAGWRHGAERDDARKLHPSLVSYAELSEEEKEKDRNQVRGYPALLARAGLAAMRRAAVGAQGSVAGS